MASEALLLLLTGNLMQKVKKAGITCAPQYHIERDFSSAIQLPLNTLHSSLRPSSVWTQTLKAEWWKEHVSELMVHRRLRELHRPYFTTSNQMQSSVEATERFYTCLSTLITILKSRINLQWETGMNINMLKNDSPSKNSTCLSVLRFRGVARAANIHYLISQHA